MIRTLTVRRFRVARIPSDVALWLKALLVAALAVQGARLIWAAVTPVGPLGDWRPAGAIAIPSAAQAAVIAAVNPFDRVATGAAAVSLPSDLKLFGVRASAGAVPGGAIVGLPDGQQISVSIGETVMPGVVLVTVGFDYAEVDRQGTRQRLFMDQDRPPETLRSGGASAVPQAVTASRATVEAVRSAVRFFPRRSQAGLTGIRVMPGGDQATFTAIGFRHGDVIVAVNGTTIASESDVAQLQQSLTRGASLALTVDRGGQRVPITLNLAGSR
ncbi:MAG TPA: type II secretion system protein N [Vicinamibacterales bacterium]|nr:type II secretion system protein N [Vicinamibacterales bacterium]